MYSKRNKIFTGLLVLQLATIFAYRGLSVRRAKTTKLEKLFANFNADSVSEIEIAESDKGNEKTVRLKKVGDQWLLASHGDYPVKKERVTQFLAKFPAVEAGPVVGEKATLHSGFKVAAKEFERRVTVTGANKTNPAQKQTFYLGSTPGTRSVHFRSADQDVVRVAKNFSAWDAGSQATDWVEANYFTVEREKVAAITLKNINGEFHFEKIAPKGSTEKKWHLKELPQGAVLNDSEVDSLLNSTASISLQEPVGKDLKSEYGLDNPTVAFSLTTDATPPKTYQFRIGAKVAESYFAQSSESPFVVRIGNWIGDDLAKKKIETFKRQTETAKDSKAALSQFPAVKG